MKSLLICPRKITKLLGLTVTALIACTAQAAPFNTLDTRAMAMGDTGVASAQPASAAIFNPALLSNYTAAPKIALIIPGFGVNAFAGADVDDALEALDEERQLTQLSNMILDLNTFNLATFQQNTADFSRTAVDLTNNLQALQDRPFNIQGNALISFAMPNDDLGFAVYLDANAVIETTPFISDCDIDVLLGYTEFFTQVALDNVSPGKFVDVNCTDRNEQLPIVVLDQFGLPAFVDPITSKSPDTGIPYLVSSVEVAAVNINEIGFSLSQKFSFADFAVSVGVTPKYMSITSFYTHPTVQQIDDGEFDLLDALRSNRLQHNAVNLDAGLAMNFLQDQSITLGMVIKNLIQQSFNTARFERPDGSSTRTRYNLNTQVRMGFAWRSHFGLTISSDIDLTDNKPYFTGISTQYFGIGGEYSIGKVLDLRLGGRTNFSNTNDSVVTAGFGLNILVVRLDLAAEYGDNNIGFAAQIGMNFR
ncbi:Uncharacterised protein [BD1-7 clade bacterium]|uniref:Conjugal transfer protein TraF n=1 Tax=BD1-7 clade bacterium TaxID=2029982 RepID=A0A5S9N968_9GAMM|nr:Uncharacterised protein [BD1-7 clade bacterium]